MSNSLYVVVGATGHIGKEIVLGLLAKGKKVRAWARTASKLEELAARGAETLEIDLQDGAAVKKGFDGATAAFVMIPPNYTAPNFRDFQNRIGQALADGIRASGIKHVVNLSSIGAHLPDKTGPIAGLYDQEQRLNRLSDVHIVHLRPAFFMENLLGNIPALLQMNVLGSAMKKDLAFPHIATRDIAAVAVDLLDKLEFTGKQVRELLGPRDVSMGEVARVFGAAIGKPDLPYVQFSYSDVEKAFLHMGMSPDAVRTFIEMARGFNEGLVVATQPRSALTNTPTDIEQFASVFAAAYKAERESRAVAAR
ncbi:MAG TPA: NmrA family NAD(P)-binding protein [Elusimicrobiota bacterium]|nr:NmrA family NAD(P)-binding protein [Elusimicrobiota bacterium]